MWTSPFYRTLNRLKYSLYMEHGFHVKDMQFKSNASIKNCLKTSFNLSKLNLLLKHQCPLLPQVLSVTVHAKSFFLTVIFLSHFYLVFVCIYSICDPVSMSNSFTYLSVNFLFFLYIICVYLAF